MSRRLLAAGLLLACFAPPGLSGEEQQGSRASLVSFEGVVLAVEGTPGEGDLEVVTLVLAQGRGGDDVRVLLAPETALSEIGFEAQMGDSVRVRIFTETEGLARAHKIMNLSRGTMVRLRTLHRIPLWDTTGAWQGGPCGQSPGAAGSGQRRRGGGGPPH